MISPRSAWWSLALGLVLLACKGGPPGPTVGGDPPPMVSLAGGAPATVAPPRAGGGAGPTSTATAAQTSLSSTAASPAVADGGAGPPCGYAPAARSDERGFGVPSNAGCGLAPETAEPHKSVVSIDVVSLTLGPKRTVVELVFLDAEKRRLLPLGRKLSFDMRFKHRQRGELRLKEAMHRDGVFKIELSGNDRAKPCSSHLFLRLHNGKERLEEWVDDWLYRC